MKDLCAALFEFLSQDSDLKSMLNFRIYPMMLPQNVVLPAIVYTPTSAKYDSALGGDTGYVRQNVQFNCHETAFKKARELSRIIRQKIQDYKGEMYGVNIEAVFVKTDFILEDNTTTNFSTEEYIAVLEFEIHFNENRRIYGSSRKERQN